MLLSGPSSAYIALLFCSPQPMRWERLLRSCQEMWMPAHCQLLWQEREKQRQKVTISVAKRQKHPLRKTQGFEKEATMEEGWEEAAPRATEGCFLQPALEAQPEAFVCTYLHRAAGLKTPASKACVSTRDTHTHAHTNPPRKLLSPSNCWTLQQPMELGLRSFSAEDRQSQGDHAYQLNKRIGDDIF